MLSGGISLHTFNDRAVTFSIYRVLAVVFGGAGLACALTAAAFYLAGRDHLAGALGVVVVPLIGAGAVMRIRAFFCTLHERWTCAFEMGRQLGHQQGVESPDGTVTPLR